jgi:hypothetical protein
VAEDNLLRKIIEEGPVIKNSSDLQITLRDVYETTYGIYDHNRDQDEDLLSLVAMREVEDPSSGGLLYERIRQYFKREIHKFTGYTPTQFLELPTDLVNYILEQALKQQASAHTAANDAANEVQQQMNLF